MYLYRGTSVMNIPQKSLAFALIGFGFWCVANGIVILSEWLDLLIFGLPY
tara:strand:- start:1529 stop:1678 length:150 start_codon:yes stop_codon:yes gene_type:complete